MRKLGTGCAVAWAARTAQSLTTRWKCPLAGRMLGSAGHKEQVRGGAHSESHPHTTSTYNIHKQKKHELLNVNYCVLFFVFGILKF